ILIDTVTINEENIARLKRSLSDTLKYGKGSIVIQSKNGKEDARHFSRSLMCPTTGISYDEPAPNLFSFNSPYGACPTCNGLGTVLEIDIDKIIPDKKLSIKKGGIAP